MSSNETAEQKQGPDRKRPRPNESKGGTRTTFQRNGKTDGPRNRQRTNHSFGSVMEKVPCRNKPRFSTLSIAIPGSILSYCQTKELKTQMVGQIARAATIYHVDEIVVFDDKLSKQHSTRSDREDTESNSSPPRRSSDPHSFMARLLQYCECPQYLRRALFPMHPDLQFAGLLAPIDAPHHVRAYDKSRFREGVVLDKQGSGGGSLVNCGIRSRPVEIDRNLPKGVRCTVQLDPAAYGKPVGLKGTVVSPSSPRERDGTYWGYSTRMAASLKEALDDCPFEGGYDLKIGTSERGNHSIDNPKYKISKYYHALIVFGGVSGIEECVDVDESLSLAGSQSKTLFDHWVNVCPYQGSRTIRTEEAVLITLAKYSSLLANASTGPAEAKEAEEDKRAAEPVNFSDGNVSDESSDGEKESSDA